MIIFRAGRKDAFTTCKELAKSVYK